MKPTNSAGQPAFTCTEADLAEQLGISQDVLKEQRIEVLQRGRDWQLIGGRITYTAPARAKILGALKISVSPEAPGSPPAGADSGAAAQDAAVGVSSANPDTVVCRPDAAGGTISAAAQDAASGGPETAPGQPGTVELIVSAADIAAGGLGIGDIAGGPVPSGDLAPNTAGEKIAAAGPLVQTRPDVVDLICMRMPMNRHIVLARMKDAPRTAALVRVRVRDSSNFVAGMELQARHLGADLYQFEGRCPRYHGRY